MLLQKSCLLETEETPAVGHRLAEDDVIKEADLQNPRAGLKKGVWGESRLTFEFIVEEVRRFCGTYASRRLDDRLGLLSVEFLSAWRSKG
jgi:hypothetical protein